MDTTGASLLAKLLPTSPSALVWCGLALAMGGGQVVNIVLDYNRLESRVAKVEEKMDAMSPTLASMQTDIGWIRRELERRGGHVDAPH